MHVSRRIRTTVGAIAVVGLTLGGAACAKDKEEKDKDGGTAAAVASPTTAAAAAPTTAAPAASDKPAAPAASDAPAAPAAGGNCTYKNYAGGVDKIDLKTSKLGFAQSEKENNPWRSAETKSFKDEAAKLGYEVVITNAGGDLNQEITDIKGMVAQGVKAMVISPLKSDGLQPALEEAKAKKVPVMTVDRLLTDAFKPCEDYIGFAGSNFIDQGKRAAQSMIKATGGKAKAVTLLGAAGVNVADERNKGYVDEIKASGAGIEILAEQTGDFDRTKGQAVTEQLLAAHPDLNAIYAHNDEMALGAVAALKAAGKKAGDVKIVTIDGTRGAVQGIVDGWVHGVIESNPRFGPLAFQSLDKFYNGEGVPAKQIITDAEYTTENAKENLGNSF